MGFNIHILSGRNRSTNLPGHAALAASFNPRLDSSQKQPALAGQQAEQRQRIHRRGAFLVIVKIDVDVAITVLPHLDRLAPGSERSSRVAAFVSATRAMAAQIDEVRSAFPWRWRIMVIRNTKRYISIGQDSKNVWRVPTGMTEFKAVSAVLRKQCQKGAKPASIRREVWRELKKNWPDLVTENR